MAAVSRAQASKQPPISLKEETCYEDLATCRIYHEWTDPATSFRVKRSADTLYSPDASNKELLLRSFHEYIANCADDLLRLNDAQRHTRAREILGGHLKTRWTQVVAAAQAAQPAAVQDADFSANVRTFMKKYLPPNAFLLQDSYLRAATKPFSMDCYALADRIDLINELSIYLPGSKGNKLFGDGTDDTERKNAYYRLMPTTWQLHFDATGNDLANDAYTIDNLVAFMEQQRLLQDNKRQKNQRSGGRSNRTTPQRNSNRHRPYPSSRSYGGRGYSNQQQTPVRPQFQHQQYRPQVGGRGGRGNPAMPTGGRNAATQYARTGGRAAGTQTYGQHRYNTRRSTGGNAPQYARTRATQNLFFNNAEEHYQQGQYEYDDGYFNHNAYENSSGHVDDQHAYFHGEHDEQPPEQDGFFGEPQDDQYEPDDYPQDFYHDHDPQGPADY